MPSRITDDMGNPVPGLSLIEPDPNAVGPTLTMSLKDDVPIAAGELFTVDLSMCNLCSEVVAGYQAFLKFDSAQLNFIADESVYTADPFGFIVEPFTNSSNDTGCITVAASINQSAGQEPTSAEALLAGSSSRPRRISASRR